MRKTGLAIFARLGAIALVLALTLPLTTALAAEAPAQTGVTATTTVNLRLRSGPGTTHGQIGLLPAGTTVPVNGRNDAASWLFVDYGGSTGWIAAWYTTVSGGLGNVPVTDQSGTATQTANTGVTATTNVNLRVRSGPGTSYSTLTVAAQGSTLSIYSRTADSSWIYIDKNGTRGWMAAWYTTINGDINAVPVAGSGETTPAAPAAPQPTPTPTTSNAGVTATTNVNINVRSGPGTNNGVITWAPSGTTVTVLGKNADAQWALVDYNGTQGWMAAWLLTINGTLNDVPVASGATTQPTTETPTTTTPTTSLPSTAGFGLGGQTQSLSRPDIMHAAGMTWMKYQQKWTPGANPGDLQGIIDAAHANGFRILISIPGELYPASIDFGSYVQYLRGVASLGADAIEVWNEMNLNREWPSGQVSPASYVSNMLAPAYQNIKAVNPNTIVIAGALAPTGVNIGNDIMSDDRYLAGMAAAGAANYMDCLGVHHNAGATSPDVSAGHPADDGAGHYSWYFDPTFNLYAGNFPSTQLCYTEIGYLTGDGYPPIPANFSWASGTDINEHAQWLGRAIQKLRASGRVRLAIVFNVDFSTYTDDPQAGYAILRPDGSCPACGTLSAALQ